MIHIRDLEKKRKGCTGLNKHSVLMAGLLKSIAELNDTPLDGPLVTRELAGLR